ncbi:substrate-binding domain-containing protein [Oceaniglobus trochenteri]|uniref:substrate-binding domain-containing protein n=1 Tax=Oceaniglobus trochenteri TaxID=2763260 RepID=UPI001CFFFC61|nr:substrate-binding domain-containing protein [Oceaniglobus trochenteri]
MSRPTISDLARLAGVSKTTVSHAFSGRRHVDPETCRKIKELAQQIGYRPNRSAQSLRTGRTGMIALASSMPFSIAAGPSRLGFFMEIAAAAAVASLTRNQALCLFPPIAADTGPQALAMDGAILVEPFRDDPMVERYCSSGIPVVSIGRVPGRDDIPFVDLRSHQTALMVLGHLRDSGANRIALVTGAQRRNSYLKTEAAYAAFCTARNMPEILLRIDEAGGEPEAEGRCAALLADHPEIDALFVPVDAFASGAVTAARTAGREVPGKLRLATRYDGSRAKLAEPPLTAVDLHLDDIATLAVDLLIATLDGRAGDGAQPPAPTLIARRSSGH